MTLPQEADCPRCAKRLGRSGQARLRHGPGALFECPQCVVSISRTPHLKMKLVFVIDESGQTFRPDLDSHGFV